MAQDQEIAWHKSRKFDSDLLIGSAYVAISLSLYFIARRIKIQFSAVVLSFGVFIGACGATHFMEIWNLWHAHYWLGGWVKVVTAIASVATSVYLIRLRPQIFKVAEAAKSADEHSLRLENLNHVLEERVAERTAALKILTEELEVAKEKAEVASRAKTMFLANMSHEIRTPLGAMLGFAELALEKSVVPEVQKSLETVIRNGNQLYRLIDEVLDISKVEAEKLHIHRVEFNLDELLSGVGELLEFKAREKGLDFEIIKDRFIGNRFFSDPSRLRQVLLNVVGNAIKFTQNGSVKVSARIVRHEDNSSKKQLEIAVKDSGPGISPEQLKNLFQPFTQVDQSNSRKFGGTGLGLYLSRRLCQAMGGDLTITECKVGEGCTFTITVCLEGQSESSTVFSGKTSDHGDKKLKLVSKQTLTSFKILVTDDSADNLELLYRYLVAADASQVDRAQNGSEAIQKVSQSKYDIVLMDIQMPVLDGFEVLARLRKIGYTGPVVAVTAHAMRGEKERCLAAGFDGYLVKPVDRAALIDEIVSQVGARRGES